MKSIFGTGVAAIAVAMWLGFHGKGVTLSAASAGTDRGAASLAQAIKVEADTDRPGQDYYSFDLRDPKAELCRTACERDGRCRAFTFVRPGVLGRYARCYLKKAVPPRRSDRCCISGVKP